MRILVQYTQVICFRRGANTHKLESVLWYLDLIHPPLSGQLASAPTRLPQKPTPTYITFIPSKKPCMCMTQMHVHIEIPICTYIHRLQLITPLCTTTPHHTSSNYRAAQQPTLHHITWHDMAFATSANITSHVSLSVQCIVSNGI